MREDSEGFRYPSVDHTSCIECGLCEGLCPSDNIADNREPLALYAAKSRDNTLRQRSSSGGVFTHLASEVIEKGGVVFGAQFNKGWEVIHTSATTLEGLAPFRGSKYLQSSIGGCYREAKSLLESGRKVLFSGTPCQIAGLKRYLGREYESLTTIDFICHGVASERVWRNYLRWVCGNNTITAINFRDKSLGWNASRLTISSKQSTLSEDHRENLFMRGYIADLFLRPSCYACPVKSGQSVSDVTLADYWGVERAHPEIYDQGGVSLVIAHNKAVSERLQRLPITLCETTAKDAFRYNPSALRSAKMPSGRERLFAKGGDDDMITRLEELLKAPIYKQITRTIRCALTPKKR